MLHSGMPYDLIQDEGRETFRVRNSSSLKFSSIICNRSWQMAADSYTRRQCTNLIMPDARFSMLASAKEIM